MTEITGKAAIVTGGGSGIGQSLCLALANAGARVVVADIIADKAEAVAEAIRASGGEAIAVVADVCERAEVQALKEAANAEFGPIQLLFANAGATSFERLTAMPDKDVDWLFQVNLMGVVHCLQAFLPQIIESGDGHVVATASTSGLMPGWVPSQSCYASSKMGIIGLIFNLRYELGLQGIGASVLCPGPTSTGMKDNNGLYRPARFGGPTAGPVVLPAEFTSDPNQNLNFREPADVAQMTLRAVRDNFPLIVLDADDYEHFQRTYLDVVNEAFGRAREFASTNAPRESA
jgi:NAD(P)-dependent dehydrogenase (short-subunit alcohol dehydrogenase family)